MTSSPLQIEEHPAAFAFTRKEILTVLGLLVVTAALGFALFNRETALSHSIGYNLYGAERVLGGEVPYRDFHTLYTPAILYLNAALFYWFGISLYTALAGVLVCKLLTTLLLYGCARQLLPARWSLLAAAYSLIWLRPNGPYKAVPMHYGAVFLTLGLYGLLRACRPSDQADRPAAVLTSVTCHRGMLLVAGISLGILALFKHNIGVYALLGATIVLLSDESGREGSAGILAPKLKRTGWTLLGFVLPILPVVAYMKGHGALGSMVNTLLYGPGEFLLNRLAEVPSPLVPILVSVWVGLCFYSAGRVSANRAAAAGIVAVAAFSVLTFALLAPQRLVDAVIFYLPAQLLLAGLLSGGFARRLGLSNRRELLLVTMMAAAAFMEAFPRFAREQAVAAMPFIGLLLIALLYSFRDRIAKLTGSSLSYTLALMLLPSLLFVMGGRLFMQTFFASDLRLRSDTELKTARGRGVFFPADRAREIDDTVEYIRQHVPEGGYLFPQSYAGSSYLFLADRNNPSGAQFWGGVGVSEAERATTLEALRNQDVPMVITSRRDSEAEKYLPMRQLLETNFRLTREFGETLVLERISGDQQ